MARTKQVSISKGAQVARNNIGNGAKLLKIFLRFSSALFASLLLAEPSRYHVLISRRNFHINYLSLRNIDSTTYPSMKSKQESESE